MLSLMGDFVFGIKRAVSNIAPTYLKFTYLKSFVNLK